MSDDRIILHVEVFGGAVPSMDGVPFEIRDAVYRVAPVARDVPAPWAFCVRHKPLDHTDPVLRGKAEALTVGWAIGRLGLDEKVMVEWWQEGA
jgi:hypothetical protein